jgi:hypothetical protein
MKRRNSGYKQNELNESGKKIIKNKSKIATWMMLVKNLKY